MVLIFDLAQVKKDLKSADFNIYTEQMQTAERHAERHAERITEIDKAKQIEQIKSGLCNDDKILICNCGLVGANKSPKRALLK